MLCLIELFVLSYGFIGPEKPYWGSDQLRYFLIIIYHYYMTRKITKARTLTRNAVQIKN